MNRLFLLLFFYVSTLHSAQIVRSFDATAKTIVGLDYDINEKVLWAVSQDEKTVYKLNDITGQVIASFKSDTSGFLPYGITTYKNYPEEGICVPFWDGKLNNDSSKCFVVFYSFSGTKQRVESCLC